MTRTDLEQTGRAFARSRPKHRAKRTLGMKKEINMKRVFFFGVIVYSALILLLNDLPGAVGNTGTAALPWMAKCLIDISFAGLGCFKLFGNQIHWDDEEVGVHPEDVSVPDAWLYGVFGLNLLANFGWHGYQFAVQSGAESLYNALWFFCEFVAMFLTFVLFKHAGQVARREARKARGLAPAQEPTQFKKAS